MKQTIKKTIYDLELNEILDVAWGDRVSVMRVPGGWIYVTYNTTDLSTVFVPFNNEFQKP